MANGGSETLSIVSGGEDGNAKQNALEAIVVGCGELALLGGEESDK